MHVIMSCSYNLSLSYTATAGCYSQYRIHLLNRRTCIKQFASVLIIDNEQEVITIAS